jgi:indolepyruvate ferredoxin oxidoreductase
VLLDAQSLATDLLGDAIYANPLILGAAWQLGWIPLQLDSLLRAIELNGVSIEANRRAFDWGRAAACDAAGVAQAAARARNEPVPVPPATTLEDIVALRVRFLEAYQDKPLAARYRTLVERVAAAERRVGGDAREANGELAIAVARNYYKLLAVKDEYEVARLHRDPAFRARLAATFSGNYRVHYHLAPPLLSRRDPLTGHLRKRRFGPWLGAVFAVLAPLRFLRGSPLDPFGYSAERRMERALVRDYEALVEEILPRLARDNAALALRMASFPEEIRGFGHVKQKSVDRMLPLLAQWRREWGGGNAGTVVPVNVKPALQS